MVIAPAETGKDNNNKKEVTNNARINNGILNRSIFPTLILKIVTIKFIEPINDDAPARCELKMTKSTGGPG
jgi:hypothetical protein